MWWEFITRSRCALIAGVLFVNSALAAKDAISASHRGQRLVGAQ